MHMNMEFNNIDGEISLLKSVVIFIRKKLFEHHASYNVRIQINRYNGISNDIY